MSGRPDLAVARIAGDGCVELVERVERIIRDPRAATRALVVHWMKHSGVVQDRNPAARDAGIHIKRVGD